MPFPAAAPLSPPSTAAMIPGADAVPAIPAFPVLQPVAESSNPAVGSILPEPLPMPPPASVPVPLPPGVPPVIVPAPYRGAKPQKKSKTPFVVAMLAVLLVAAGGGVYFFLMLTKEPEPVVVRRATTVAPRPTAPVVEIPALPPPPAVVQAEAEAAAAARANAVKAPVAPVPTPAFRAWVNDARVTGVRSGDSARAMINNRLIRAGEVADAAEGITLESVIEEEKSLLFRHRDGAALKKPY